MEKIQELTEKLLREGVEKGQAEADRIIEQAKEQAEQILKDARQQAQEIVAQAQKQAGETAANTRSELKMYTGQALSALKSEVTNVLTDGVVKEAVDGLAASPDFLGRFAVALAEKWSANEPIVISSSEADSLKAFFAAKAKALLDKGVTINKVNGKDTLLTIAPVDGSYKVNFGKEEFETYFKNFLRPQLVEMLF
jgi:V/A-type H+-transporting ATPase subunit E